MKQYRKNSNKNDAKSEFAIDDDESMLDDDEIGLPEDVRVVYGEEVNPNGG